MERISIGYAIVSGFIAVFVALAVTYFISLVIPTANLAWSIIAVSFASFFSGVSGYIVGAKSRGKGNES